MGLLFKMMGRRRLLSLVAICASLAASAVALWWNAQLGDIINAVSTGATLSQGMVSRALAAMCLMGTSNYAKSYLSGAACEGLTHDLRMGYARHFTALSVDQIEKLNAGEQLSKLQNELAGVSSYLNGSLFQLFDDGVRFLLTFFWFSLLSPVLTAAAHLPTFLLLGYVVWSSKLIGTATGRSLKAKGQMNQWADTLLTLFPVIRLYDAARMLMEGYTDAVKAWEGHTVQSERVRARLMSLSALLSCVPLLLLFLVGGHMTINGGLSLGTLYIFLNLSGNVSGVLMNMPGHIAAFHQFSANIGRLSPYIALEGRKP